MAKKPVVKKGNHLTVTTHTDGKVELEWDWNALAKEITDALSTVKVEPKKKKVAKKKESK